MRKNVIALMLVLPLLFMFIVYTATSGLSLDTEIAVTSISILGADVNRTVSIDLAEEPEFVIEVDVQPRRASNRDYDYTVTPYEENSETAEVKVEKGEDGRDTIIANSTGMARITVTSRSGGHVDSIVVRAYASGTYDFNFFLFAEGEEEGVLGDDVFGVYSATVPVGKYDYSTQVLPSGYMSPRIAVSEEGQGGAVVYAAAGTILFPYVGKEVFTVTIPNPNNPQKEISKKVELNVTAEALEEEAFLVNGNVLSDSVDDPNNTIDLGTISASGEQARAESTSLYVQTNSEEIAVDVGTTGIEYEIVPIGKGQYRVDLTFATVDDKQSIVLTSGETSRTVNFNFTAFSFAIKTDIGQEEGGDAMMEINSTTLLLNTPISFSAVPETTLSGVVYLWEILTPMGALLPPQDYADTLQIEINADGSVCTITPRAYTSFILRAQAAFRLDDSQDPPTAENSSAYSDVQAERISLSVIRQVAQIQIVEGNNKAFTSLGGTLAIAGSRYEGSGSALKTVANTYALNILAYDGQGQQISGISDLDLISSNENFATVDSFGVLTPGITSGSVTITAAWKGNDRFQADRPVRASITFDIARFAYEVRTSEQILHAMGQNREVVLGADIMLGTNATGGKLALEELRAMLAQHRMRSTYNTEFYKNNPNLSIDDAYVNYVLEFTNNVYGNGYTINAEYFTNAVDSTGAPQLFKGPLDLVSAGATGISASVAAQDNIAYLCRTNNITLYNVELLGCSDSSLETENGTYDLTKLNNMGTTLEINADVNVINCRIRNGRNVVRVYGGNRDGSRYFIESLNEIDAQNGVSNDRINVNIEGCIITQGREFLVKVGTNRALRASTLAGSDPMEPYLGIAGTVYENPGSGHRTNDALLSDEEFYKMFVMTDLTIADSVLETSGLFSIGVESNFAGMLLYETLDERIPWGGTGGTSFASVLRLKGDVRLYDWKNLGLVDSSTLIEVDAGAEANELFAGLQLDIAAMINLVTDLSPEAYNLIEEREEVQYVHGGIAFYGGGRNYSMFDISELNAEYKNGFTTQDGALTEYYVNIGILAQSSDTTLQLLGQVLPYAAGTQDFRFYMYSADCANNYDKQLKDAKEGTKYIGVKPVERF